LIPRTKAVGKDAIAWNSQAVWREELPIEVVRNESEAEVAIVICYLN
jgi:hypothetical protein